MAESYMKKKEIEYTKRQTAASETQANLSLAAIKLSVVAIIISIATFSFSMYSYFYPRVEQANIIVERLWGDYNTTLIETGIAGSPAIVPIYWECTINNQGDRTISLIDYAVVTEEIDARLPEVKRALVTYSNLKLGLYENLQTEFKMPTPIEAGKSTKFLMKLGLSLDEKAYEIAKKKYSKGATFSIQEFLKFLADNGVDPFGNIVTPTRDQSGNVRGWDGPSLERKEQIFHIKFKSSRNNYFEGTASWFLGKRF